MAVSMQAMLDKDENDVECATLLVLDEHRVQKVNPFGRKVDLLLDVARRYGLARVDRYSSFDTEGQIEVPGWELTVDLQGIATVRYPGPGQHLTRTRLVGDDRWWSAAAARGVVTLLAVGGSTYARDLHADSDAIAELDAAAQHGLLVAGTIAFTQQDSKANHSPEWTNWPLHGLTITSENGRWALNISSVTGGLLKSMPLQPNEVKPLATALARAVADSDVPVNVSEIVLAVTGRRLPPVNQ
jgi:hypothetical protein